jgi:hypothetical protein
VLSVLRPHAHASPIDLARQPASEIVLGLNDLDSHL